MRTQALFLVVAAAVLMLVSVSGRAQMVTYSDEASFLAAAGGGLSLADFEGLGDNTYLSLSNATEPSVPVGVTFSSSGGFTNDLFVAPAGFDSAIATDSLIANYLGTPLFADFAPSVTAVGSSVLSWLGPAMITIDVRDGNGVTSSYSVTPPQGGAGYFGVTALGGLTIDRMTWTPPSGYTAGIDNLRFGAPAAVPEPGSLALLCGVGSATLWLGLLRRPARR